MWAFAVQAMAVCAAPAMGCMLLGLAIPGMPDLELGAVWLGLTVLMSMRSITIYLPWRLRRSPFEKVFLDGAQPLQEEDLDRETP